MIGITLKNFQERAVDFLFETTTNINSKPKIVLKVQPAVAKRLS